ncbi:MAG: hypothetical protein BZ136_01120, partial [Methanosphaera sp. rholeuAM74]
KLNDVLSYPLDIFKKKNINKAKHEYDTLNKLLLLKLKEWDDLKSVRGLIEDFFKVGKDLFGLGRFHKYTTKSMIKSIYLS